MSGGSEAVLMHLSLEGRLKYMFPRLSHSPLSLVSLSRLSLSPLSLWGVHVRGVGSGADADGGSACCVVQAEGPLQEVRRCVPASGRGGVKSSTHFLRGRKLMKKEEKYRATVESVNPRVQKWRVRGVIPYLLLYRR